MSEKHVITVSETTYQRMHQYTQSGRMQPSASRFENGVWHIYVNDELWARLQQNRGSRTVEEYILHLMNKHTPTEDMKV